MTTVLAVGDLHADIVALQRTFQRAQVEGANHILQVGDFGYWPRWRNRYTFLGECVQLVDHHGIELTFIDGNHEDHVTLQSFNPGTEKIEVMPGVWWAPRGSRWVWGGRTFGALGGAYSVDFAGRVPGKSVFPDLERTTRADVDRLGTESLDVLVTHDCPASVVPIRFPAVAPEVEAAARESKILIETAIHNTGPSLVLHGHIHHRHSANHETNARVEGFQADARPGCFGLLDLDTLLLQDVPKHELGSTSVRPRS